VGWVGGVSVWLLAEREMKLETVLWSLVLDNEARRFRRTIQQFL